MAISQPAAMEGTERMPDRLAGAAGRASTYQPLDVPAALQYALAHPPLNTTGDTTGTAREVGDGNLNLIFIVTGESGASAVIKQALPYVRLVGEGWPLTIDRNRLEREAFAVYAPLVPDLLPHIFHSDDALALFIMEDLSRLEVVRGGMVGMRPFPRLAGDIARFCAETAIHTSDFHLTSADKKRAVQRAINPELCKITEDLVLTDPFFDAPSNSYEPALQPDLDDLWADGRAQANVASLRYAFATRAEALLHGDLHTGSVMGSPAETKIVDPEFSFYGPIGFDIGMFIANLFLSAVSHHTQCRNDVERRYAWTMLDAATETWSTFRERADRLLADAPVWQLTATARTEFLTQILRDAVGYAGAEMIRRTVGLARVADLEKIEDMAVRVRAKSLAIRIGQRLIREHRVVDHYDQAQASVLRAIDEAS